MGRSKGFARLLPDFRTIYVGLDELEQFQDGGSEADGLLRAMEYASTLFRERPDARERVDRLLRAAGLPPEDDLGQELGRALVARAHFLREIKRPFVDARGSWPE